MRFPGHIESRISAKTKIVGDCFEWTGQLNQDGYGIISFKNKDYRVHRLAWILKNGEEPNGMLLHKCDNRKCLNLNHLYIGDHKQNAADAVSRNRLFAQRIMSCPKGHIYDEKNTRLYKGRRSCRACDRERKAIK